MGSSICAGIIMAWLHNHLKNNQKPNGENSKIIKKNYRKMSSIVPLSRKNIERKDSLPPCIKIL